LAPRNEALARAKAKEEFLARQGPGFVGRLFGGVDDPRLSGDQNAQARRQAVLQGGFQGLIAAGQGQNIFSTIGAIGAGAGAARQGLNEQLGEANEDLRPDLETETQIVELIGSDGFKHKFVINKRTGEQIADLGPSAELEEKETEDLRSPIKVMRPNGDIVFAFPDLKGGGFRGENGEILVGVVPVQEQSNLQRRPFIDAAGNEYEVLWDPKTGQDVPGSTRPTGLPSGDDEESDDLTLANAIDRNVDTLTEILTPRGMKPYGVILTKAAQNDWTRGLAPANLQVFNAAAQDILSRVIRSRSGAQASDKEVVRLQTFAIPLPGDKPDAVIFKLNFMRQIAADLRGGRDPFDRVRDPSQPDGLADAPNAANPYASRYNTLTPGGE
jgi:hypothetical protein